MQFWMVKKLFLLEYMCIFYYNKIKCAPQFVSKLDKMKNASEDV